MSQGAHIHRFTDSFITESGFELVQPQVAYHSWGKLNRERNNVVVICHALTGSSAADDWFSGFFGPGKTLDPDRDFIICANVLGSCYGSTGPTSTDPRTGKPYKADFPQVSIRDMVRFQQRLFDDLDIRGIRLAIGGSMGGMQVLEMAIMDSRVESIIAIGMGKAHSAWAIGTSEAQRRAIYADPNWNNGFYSNDKKPEAGLSAARMMAMISYRTANSFEHRFGRSYQNGTGQFQVQSYLDYQGQKLNDRFDAVTYVRLTEAMDSHDIARGRGSYQQVLGKISIPALIVGIDSDLLYPVQEQKELADLLGNGQLSVLHSDFGHDAFLIEFNSMEEAIRPFLNERVKSQTVQP